MLYLVMDGIRRKEGQEKQHKDSQMLEYNKHT